MYFLNDQHDEFEYILYVKVGNATPYLAGLRPMRTWKEIMDTIEWIEKKHSKPYMDWFYIDNDFYENKYPLIATSTYYKILRRKVNDWQTFKTKDNLIYLKNVTQM